MKQTITFNDLFTLGEVIKTNQLYEHFYFSKFLDMYDANYINFKQNPNLEHFKEAEDYLKQFHLHNGQYHLKFRLPSDTTPAEELSVYLKKENYDIDQLELMVLKKENFPELIQINDIEIKRVNLENLKDFLDLRYNNDKLYGEDYAKRKTDLLIKQFKEPSITFLVAYYKNAPAGCVNLIETINTLEIDDLFVHKHFRHKKIASFLQHSAILHAYDKQIFLNADANDTPRNMYLKQGYQILATRYDISKTF